MCTKTICIGNYIYHANHSILKGIIPDKEMKRMSAVRYANLTDDTSVEEDEDGTYTVGSQGSEPIVISEQKAYEYIEETGAVWVLK